MTEKEFIAFVKKECKYYGVKCKLSKSRYIRWDNSTASGYFDDTSMALACAIKRPDYLGILAHEYCHMTQWSEKAPVWIAAIEAKSYQAWADHLNGKPVEMDTHFQIMRDLELDNEKRTALLIKKLDLPIDIKLYIKKANAYVMLYNYMRITGLWAKPNNSPYTNERILAAMPDRFSLDYSMIPKRFIKIYKEECIGYNKPESAP